MRSRVRYWLMSITAFAVPAGIVLYAMWPHEPTQEVTALTIDQAIAASIEAWPPVGQCRAVEVVLPDVDGVNGDASADLAVLRRARIQRPFEICTLAPDVDAGEDPVVDAAAVAQGVRDRRCRLAARALCNGDDVDGGAVDPDDPTRREQWRCRDLAESACQQAARMGGVVWLSDPYPATTQTKAVQRVSRAAVRDHICACRDVRPDGGTGNCRWWAYSTGINGMAPDAMVRVPAGLIVPASRAQGPGCSPVPCVESEAREELGGPGSVPREAAPECWPD